MDDEKFIWAVETRSIIGKEEINATCPTESLAIALAIRRMDYLSTQDKHHVNSTWIKEKDHLCWVEKYRLTKITVKKIPFVESI